MWKIGDVILGRYEIDDLLPEGGQAILATSQDRMTGHTVMVRALATSPEASNYNQELARFERCASLCIGHPNVIDPIDKGKENGQHYMVLPYFDGSTLAQYVRSEGGRLHADGAKLIVHQIAEGLSACHAKGVTHRDIKPENILIDDQHAIRIIDLGLCSLSHESTLTQGNGFQGSLHWVAPEQVINPGCGDHRIDLYALGAIYYYLLTGQTTTQGDTAQDIMLSVCHWTPPTPRELDPTIPVHADAVCMQLLAKDPYQRFQCADVVVKALNGEHDDPSPCVVCRSCGVQAVTGGAFCFRCGATLDRNGSTSEQCFACGRIVGKAGACCGCLRSFGATDHRVKFRAGPLTGATFRIPEGEYDVGRQSLAPRDYHISRRQIQLSCTNGTVSVRDLNSVNATYVDGQVATGPRQLVSGAEIRIAGNYGTYTNH